MPSPNQITVSQLLRLMGTPNCPIILDVCIDEDFNADPRLIPGAKRFPYNRVAELAPSFENKRVVVVCQKGLKLSAGASAILRAEGIMAEYLEGGNFAWRDANAPLIEAKKIPELNYGKGSLWVTRHRPKIDRIACPWLIRRFIDKEAKFLFVAPNDVKIIAEKFDAIPFDVDGVYWSHRGDSCTFDTMLSEFSLETESLIRVAEIVRAADTNHYALAKEAAGLTALSLGLSRMFKDDLQQMESGLIFYDALFRWSRDARDEQHECPGY